MLLQLDAELSNPNPGSEAFDRRQAGPDAHRFAPRAYRQPGGAETGCERPALPAWPTSGPKLPRRAGLDQRLQGVLVDGLSHPRQIPLETGRADALGQVDDALAEAFMITINQQAGKPDALQHALELRASAGVALQQTLGQAME